MLFKTEITIPANTTIANKQKDILGLTLGTITKLSLFFPYGCANLVGVRLYYTGYQIFPLSRNEWVTGNDILLSYEYSFKIMNEPFSIKIHSYNLDDTYPHSPIVYAQISREQGTLQFKQLLQELGLEG